VVHGDAAFEVGSVQVDVFTAPRPMWSFPFVWGAINREPMGVRTMEPDFWRG
jgi:hypothetical protein